MKTTENFNLPLLHQNQAMKEIIINEAISKIDAFISNTIIAEIESLPDTDKNGNLYLFRPKENSELYKYYDHLACFIVGRWEFVSPKNGMFFFMRNHKRFIIFNAPVWELVNM
jgi:hypothetical protein